MNIVLYSERVHMARTLELASASPPYERVPNILRYSFMLIPGISRPGRPLILPQIMPTMYVKSIVSND